LAADAVEKQGARMGRIEHERMSKLLVGTPILAGMKERATEIQAGSEEIRLEPHGFAQACGRLRKMLHPVQRGTEVVVGLG
jgi:hypothetical protein